MALVTHTRRVCDRARTTGGAQGGRLLLAAGVFTLVNDHLRAAATWTWRS